MAIVNIIRNRPRMSSNDLRRVLNLTHFIRIPLLNQTSSTQIQETLWRVANDPVAASVPTLAYQPLQNLKLGIVGLSLPTREKRDHAVSLLQHLGDQNWQKTFFKALEAPSDTPISSTVDAERLSSERVDQFRPRPLVVDLVGLGDGPIRRSPADLRSAMTLFTFIKEPSGLFQLFCSCLYREFIAAGLAKTRASHKGCGGLEFGQTRCITTQGLKSGIPKLKPTLKHLGVDMVPRFDAVDLCEKFGDVVWAKNVHLDKVCISELIPEQVFEDGQCIGVRHCDLVSIPLPGVTWEPRSFEYLRIPHRWATGESQGKDPA